MQKQRWGEMFGVSREGEIGGLLSWLPFPPSMYGDGRLFTIRFLSFETGGKRGLGVPDFSLGHRRSSLFLSLLPFLLFLTSSEYRVGILMSEGKSRGSGEEGMEVLGLASEKS